MSEQAHRRQNLQIIYEKCLKGYPLGSFVKDPIKLLDFLYGQEVEVVYKDNILPQLKEQIVSHPNSHYQLKKARKEYFVAATRNFWESSNEKF